MQHLINFLGQTLCVVLGVVTSAAVLYLFVRIEQEKSKEK